MLKTKALFERKTNSFEPTECIIESEGYGYSRYSAFLPNASDFLALHMEQEKQSIDTQSLNLSL